MMPRCICQVKMSYKRIINLLKQSHKKTFPEEPFCLKRMINDEDRCGLQMVICTNDGTTEWVLPEHADQYREMGMNSLGTRHPQVRKRAKRTYTSTSTVEVTKQASSWLESAQMSAEEEDRREFAV